MASWALTTEPVPNTQHPIPTTLVPNTQQKGRPAKGRGRRTWCHLSSPPPGGLRLGNGSTRLGLLAPFGSDPTPEQRSIHRALSTSGSGGEFSHPRLLPFHPRQLSVSWSWPTRLHQSPAIQLETSVAHVGVCVKLLPASPARTTSVDLRRLPNLTQKNKCAILPVMQRNTGLDAVSEPWATSARTRRTTTGLGQPDLQPPTLFWPTSEQGSATVPARCPDD